MHNVCQKCRLLGKGKLSWGWKLFGSWRVFSKPNFASTLMPPSKPKVEPSLKRSGLRSLCFLNKDCLRKVSDPSKFLPKFRWGAAQTELKRRTKKMSNWSRSKLILAETESKLSPVQISTPILGKFLRDFPIWNLKNTIRYNEWSWTRGLRICKSNSLLEYAVKTLSECSRSNIYTLLHFIAIHKYTVFIDRFLSEHYV